MNYGDRVVEQRTGSGKEPKRRGMSAIGGDRPILAIAGVASDGAAKSE